MLSVHIGWFAIKICIQTTLSVGMGANFKRKNSCSGPVFEPGAQAICTGALSTKLPLGSAKMFPLILFSKLSVWHECSLSLKVNTWLIFILRMHIGSFVIKIWIQTFPSVGMVANFNRKNSHLDQNLNVGSPAIISCY